LVRFVLGGAHEPIQAGSLKRIGYAFAGHSVFQSGLIRGEKSPMAYYKYYTYLAQTSSAAFDAYHEPGITTPYSGIYRCTGCGHNVTSVRGYPLPPQNHHQHSYNQGKIQWQLIASDS
jgi:hypothetical protein